ALAPRAGGGGGVGAPPGGGGSLYRALADATALPSVIVETVVTKVWLIPAEIGMAGAEIEIARSPDHLQCVRALLKPLVAEARYDWILLDCPPSLGILLSNALVASDSVLIPMQCEYYAMEGLSVIAGLIERIRGNGANPALELEGILMTMFDNRTKLGEEVVSQVRAHYAAAVYDTVIPRNVRISEAPSFGIPVVAYDPSSKGAEAYLAFGKEFLLRGLARKFAAQSIA
ncbi:MAG: ParA family protein, partial [Kiritimatiellaeota bacterium]|nr:ParA family protein [Kiritimatiellota bacterium]